MAKRKLTDFDRKEIFRRHKLGERVINLANEYGVAASLISRVLNEFRDRNEAETLTTHDSKKISRPIKRS